MTRYEKAAKQVITNWLKNHSDREVVSLYSLSCVADTAARSLGRKSELYPSLYQYEPLVPTSCYWFAGQTAGGNEYCAVNPYYKGEHKARRSREVFPD
jgi:hypothetical protein